VFKVSGIQLFKRGLFTSAQFAVDDCVTTCFIKLRIQNMLSTLQLLSIVIGCEVRNELSSIVIGCEVRNDTTLLVRNDTFEMTGDDATESTEDITKKKRGPKSSTTPPTSCFLKSRRS
jgi:2-keto-3-deoxy-galactonokinase